MREAYWWFVYCWLLCCLRAADKSQWRCMCIFMCQHHIKILIYFFGIFTMKSKVLFATLSLFAASTVMAASPASAPAAPASAAAKKAVKAAPAKKAAAAKKAASAAKSASAA